MKKTQENTSKHAVWHRVMALILVLSMVLIPVKFPGWVQAVGQTVTDTAPGEYFTDDFSNDKLLRGVTYKWNTVGSGNVAIADGKLQLGLKDTNGHNAAYLSATTGEGEAMQDLSAGWTDYTVTAVLDRTHVPASNYMGGILGRVSKGADGKLSYYLIMVQGNNPTTAGSADKLSVKLFKIVGASSVTQYVPSGEIAVMQGTAVNAGFAASTANEVKVTFTGDQIQCWVDGELAIDYKDATDPVLSGTVGVYQQTNWQLDVKSFAVDFASGANSVKDDFVDDRFMTGVTIKWDGSQVASYSQTVDYKWELSSAEYDAVKQVITAPKNKNALAYVTGTTENGTVKFTEDLTDYTASVKINRHSAPATNYMAGMVGRLSKDANGKYFYYVFMVKGASNSATSEANKPTATSKLTGQLYKVVEGANALVYLGSGQSVTSKTGGLAINEWNDLKMVFAGNTISCYIDGDLVVSYEDNVGLYGDPVTHGTAGIYKQTTSGWVDSVLYDDFTIALNDGTVLFHDDFADDSVIQGEQQTYTVSKNAPTMADVDFTWTETLKNSSSADTTAEITANGTYYCVPKAHSWMMANAVSGSSNPMDGMTDYTISVDYIRYNKRSDKGGTDGYGSPHLLFGMQPIENDATYIWKGYAVKLHQGGPYCFEIRIDKNGKIAYDTNLGSQGGGSAAGNWRNVKATVAGNSITVVLSDLDGNPLSTKTYQGSYAATGVFGLYSEFNAVDDITPGFEFDNLEITTPDGKTFFKETFTLGENQTKAAYLAETKTFEGVLKSPSWHISNGVLTGFSSGNANMLASEFCGTTDYTKDWLDYAIDADIMLSSNASTAGFIANYNDGTYYELRLSAAGVGIYRVTTADEKLLSFKALPLNPGQWYLTKLEVDDDGKTLRGYVDSSLEVEAALTENVLAKGTMGIVINGNAKFDNFAAYSVELSDSRIFKTYKFQGEELTVLASDWSVDSAKWELKEDMLVNKEESVAVLLKKATLDNYNAELRFVSVENTKIEVIGRYDSVDATGYALSVNNDNSIKLEKLLDDGTRTLLAGVTKLDLYEMGIRLIPGKEYTLKLYMYEDQIWGFIDGVRLFAVTDSAYDSGVTAISATAGAKAVALTTSEAFDVPTLTLEDMQGNPVAGLQAYKGHTPDLKPYRVKAVYHDGSEKFADLDAIAMEGTFSTTTDGSVKFFYDFAELTVNYTVDEAVDEIADIKAKIDALNISDLKLADKDAVYALAARYNALSATQKQESFAAEQRDKIVKAQETIEVLLYPELADDPVVFRDTFDENVPGKYNNDYLAFGARDPGEWFVENGAMFMYKNRTVKQPTSFTAYNELTKRNFAVKSISVDVQIIDEKAWAGINFNSKDGKRYCFTITDKSDRIQLSGGSETVTIYANGADIPASERLTFELGQWYNLRATFDNGLIKCYVDDKLWIEFQDEETIRTGAVNENGTIMLNASENWVKYDNLVVRGTELEWKESEQWYTVNDNLPAGAFEDNFNDETATENPSHWLELSHTDFWKVMADGENLVYGSSGTTELDSSSWLHVFETDVVYKTKLRVTELGHYPIVGLTARLNADTSYIKAGFDFTLNKWFIKTRYGQDFDEVVTYGQNGTFAEDTWYDLKLDVEGTSIKLYCGDTLVAEADAGKKVSPGRVGVFTEQCDAQIDDVDLVLTSGQGRVNDGVMEQYTAQAGATSGTLFNVLPLSDGRYLLNQDGTHFISDDDGMTWTPTTEYKSFRGNSQLILQNGKIINVKYANVDLDSDGVKDDTSFTAYLSEDGGKTWTTVGTWERLNEKYAQPAEHLSEVVLDDGTHRIFYTNNNQSGTNDGVLNHGFISNVFYSDDEGATWHRSVNSPAYTTNLNAFCESHVLRSKGALPGDPLVHYSTYNTSLTIRYSLSYDGGVTWEGDYAIPDIPCGWNSMTIEQDRETGIYYMATFMQIPSAYDNGFPRLRVVLLSSEDGLNWDFVCDVDRWGDVSDADMGLIMQGVNMYLAVDKDYIFVTFSRSEAFSDSGSHNLQVGRLYRFEKSKLDPYEKWPEEFIINPKEIVYIEAKPVSTYVAEGNTFDPTGSTFVIHHYDGTTTELDMSEAFVNEGVGENGEALVYVDYKYFRDTFTVTKVADEAPVISGVENGKTYCGAVTVTVTDADLVSVTLNGTDVTLTDGKLTINPAAGIQTLVATDELGNMNTVKITINATHKGGEATCTDKAKCEVCGEAYGELNADKHTKEAKWIIGADKHSKAYECCGKVVVAEAAHKGGTATCEHKAKCEVCNAEYGALAAHKGGEATCTDKAKCDVCGEAYGELNADKHTKEAKWTTTADKHSKVYECCGKVVVAEEDHEWKDGKCEECGYEAAPGTEQKPIEIPADKETVKEEAKVEAGEEKHYELNEDMAGKVITVKGEGAYIIVDGKKYEAVNGIVEVKLPTKSGKISVVIGNAGTKAGTFSITIATPSEDNSDTGDNAAIVLFGSLMALSVLAAGVLLIPNIRKKLMQ